MIRNCDELRVKRLLQTLQVLNRLTQEWFIMHTVLERVVIINIVI